MAFPPSFTNSWDNTFPPDTQAANQLGLDLRNFRVDTQQKFTSLSGTLANRPINMEAVFGGSNVNGGFGIIYLATDTSQIFQWNGATWVDITSVMVGGRISNGVAVVTNGANQDGIVLTAIPANSLEVGSVIDIRGDITPGANNSWALFFGGTTIGPFSSNAQSNSFEFICTVLVTAAAVEKCSLIGVRHDTGIPFVDVPISSVLTGATEAISGGIVVKTRQTAGGAGMTHNYLTVTWK